MNHIFTLQVYWIESLLENNFLVENLIQSILGNPGAVSRVQRKGGTKVFKYGQKCPWVPTLTELFPKIQADPGSWLGTKNVLFCFAQSANCFSWVLFVRSYTTVIVSITACLAHALKKCTQSGNFQFDIKSPTDFKILSARELKTLFQKCKLELTTGIHTCMGQSCVNIREFLKDTTTADNHENVAWKREFTFFQFLSWLFQLAYFVKCKRTLLELNFYQPYPSSWREWILSLLVYVLHKTWN